jgi:hypothetical protein
MPRPARSAVPLLALAFLATAGPAQPPKAQVAYQPSYAAAQRLARSSGLPVMVAVVARGGRPVAALRSAKVAGASRRFVCVMLLEGSAQARKLSGAAAGSVVFVGGDGKAADPLEPGFTDDQLLEKMEAVAQAARERALEEIQKAKKTTPTAALNAYVRLGAGVGELIALLTHPNAKVQAAVGKALAARKAEGADWLLLNAMASPDAAVRAACHPAAASLTRGAKVPPVKFWKEATEEERGAALERWRRAVFGKAPPVNKAVLDFCYARYGKQVNNGECAMLVVDAFVAAGARPMRPEGKTYVWGTPLKPGEAALPGDIVQLEDAVFKTARFQGTAPHHTQVVSRVLGPGTYEVLEQNAGGRRTVGTGQLNLKILKEGSVVIYRPAPLQGGPG